MRTRFLTSIPISILTGVLLVVVVLGPPAFAQSVSATAETTVKLQRPDHTAGSSKNMVASVHPLATQAGVDAFAAGGNAIDAAIATALTLGVVDNFNSGIGGGCFVLIRTADGNFYAIDGREMAPAAAHKDLFKNAPPIPANPSRVGALASGVPGALKAYGQAVERHGKLEFSAALRAGEKAAREGFTVSKVYADKLATARQAMSRFPATTEVFFRKLIVDTPSAPYLQGEHLTQTDLAATYQSLAEHGTDWFYQGQFAKSTETWMKDHAGIMTASDFQNYKTVDRAPIKTTYRGYEIVGFPPPSSGGVHVSQILNILEHFDLAAIHQQDPALMYHVIAEAMKLAFADRAHWLGDPDFVDVPSGLIDKTYAADLAKLIDLEKTTPAQHGNPPNADTKFFEQHTTHVAAADREGNWVAITTTVNTGFGAKYIIPGTGVIMNNQMDDFVAIPGKPNVFGLVGGTNNAVAAGKRPLSSMSPTIVLLDGQPVLTVGGAGGPKIITEVLLAIIHHLDLKLPIGEAIAQPRIHHQWTPTALLVEANFSSDLASGLEARGHQLRRSKSMGICQGISFDPVTKMFQGAHDPRTTGKAQGEQ
ncbi:MAG: gamma-glutamyltranspeptidase/glutathione hydrolase [Mariniblastus sp.]|jgi:gamma-glutamyltranspeptidase/glutathione hydrolase